MSKHWFGTKFDALEHMASEKFVILYVQPLIYLECFSHFSTFN